MLFGFVQEQKNDVEPRKQRSGHFYIFIYGFGVVVMTSHLRLWASSDVVES